MRDAGEVGRQAVVGGEVVRRVGEHEVIMPRSAASMRTVSVRRDGGLEPELLQVGADRAAGGAIGVDEDAALGAARERLEPEPARAGEQVEDDRAVDGPDQVERGLADEVGRRPRRRPLRRVEPPPRTACRR